MEHGEKRRNRLVILGLCVVLLAMVVLSFSLGRYPISPAELGGILLSRAAGAVNAPVSAVRAMLGIQGQALIRMEPFWSQRMEIVFFEVRLPRVLLAGMVGCSLSAAGAAYQGVFQNPMASPDLLGASKGAGFGAALGIYLGLGSRMVTAGAFCLSLAAVFLAWLVGARAKGKRVLSLVLSGIMISSLFEAGTSFIKLVADPSNQLPAITYWLMGSLSAAKRADVALAAIPMGAGLLLLLLLRWQLSVLTMGDDEARTMGVNARALRLILIICATLVTAASVAVSGVINWVGLVVPHLARRLVGNNYRFLMPASMLLGAIFLLAADNISRCLLPTEIPLGILTAFVGAPFFLYLILGGGEGA